MASHKRLLQGSQGTRSLLNALVVLVALLGAGGTALFFQRVFQPMPQVELLASADNYDSNLMSSYVHHDSVGMIVDTLRTFGDRFLGTEGAYRTRDYIRSLLQEYGYEVFEHTVRTASPLTSRREIALLDETGAEGEPLADVALYPFLPNHMQPVATPADGVRGKLVLLTAKVIRSTHCFEGYIGVVDGYDGNADPDYGFDWVRYARLGLRGLIITSSGGLDAAPWARIGDRFSGMVSSIPVNFLRLAADEQILDYIGQNVVVRVKSEYVNVPNTTVMGVLSAPGGGATEAVIINGSYDVSSMLPDRAPAGFETVNLAAQIQIARGMAVYRESLRRDVIFLFTGGAVMAEDGLNHFIRIMRENKGDGSRNRLLQALGGGSGSSEVEGSSRLDPLYERRERNEQKKGYVDAVLARIDAPGFLRDVEGTIQGLGELESAARAFFEEQGRYVLNAIVFDLNEPLFQAKLAFERTGADVTSPQFEQYLARKAHFDRASSGAGYRILNLLRRRPEFMEEFAVRERLRERFAELAAYHEEQGRQIDEEIEIVRQMNRYTEVTAFQLRLVPAFDESEKAEVVTLGLASNSVTEQAHQFMSVLSHSRNRLGLSDSLEVVSYDPRNHAGRTNNNRGWAPNYSTRYWGRFGYAAYGLMNFGRTKTSSRFAIPALIPAHDDLGSLRHSLAISAETILSVAHGNARFTPGMYEEWADFTFGGQVLAGNIGLSMVPSFPLKGALVASRGFEHKAMFNFPGYYERQILITDPYGRYRLEKPASDWWDSWRSWHYGEVHNPMAALVDDDGIIYFMKDEGDDGQRLFKSVNLNINSGEIANVTMVLFRAAPVSVIDLTNPQTMRDYSDIGKLTVGGLTEFGRRCKWEAIGISTTFLEPDERFFALLRAGAADNELVQVTRGFMLGIDSTLRYESDREIDGPGYLVADHPFMVRVAHETAFSMAYVNERRLALQNRYNMADERTNDYHARTLAYIDSSLKEENTFLSGVKLARDAVTYASLNHPVLRESVMQAVLGIIWYLALLVPFVFFFEKLVFCYPDVRKQLAAQAGIFITVFVLLRILHPAFQMVRSSVMILLGFVIIIISGGITLLFSSKFKENLEELRKKQGKVTAAEVNTFGVMGSAFMLGLNNMHRRKMRTGLTCATLTLLTFVMISFTSVEDNIVDEDVAVAKAPYQGMLVRRERFEPLSDAEVFAFKAKYGAAYHVCERRVMTGRKREERYLNPELHAVYHDGGTVRRADFLSILQLQWNEPLQGSIELMTSRGWFAPEHDVDDALDFPRVMIPDNMAARLNVSADRVDREDVSIYINGRQFVVHGIFAAASLNALLDLDGLNLLPMDLEAMPNVVETQVNVLQADDNDPRIPAERMVIMPMQTLFGRSGNDYFHIPLSVAISMPDASYREAKSEIETYMEQTAQRVYYGLDGVAYRGRRLRGTSMAGMLDLIIPLVIAGLTVLNTMKGSVYERRSEIYVYNAVGIAPRYVFFMFIAEAFVYAVVGSILGYITSQGTGRILTMLNMTGGLNMTFTSITTIYASLTIAAAVFLSTWSPAKSAMEIAAPAEDSGWSLPEPVDDDLAFDLPFNFGTTGRVAILVFFQRYLLDNGEGSSGRFYAGTPSITVTAEPDESGESVLVPQISCLVWLKPFDLAVSQHMVITMPVDPETGLYKARISLNRLSGTRESWMRLNKGFIAQVRKHFLHWRAVSEEERQEMFEEAKAVLEEAYAPAAPALPSA